ncbi:unnamed protein product, partial [Polarella glacialis]
LGCFLQVVLKSLAPMLRWLPILSSGPRRCCGRSRAQFGWRKGGSRSTGVRDQQVTTSRNSSSSCSSSSNKSNNKSNNNSNYCNGSESQDTDTLRHIPQQHLQLLQQLQQLGHLKQVQQQLQQLLQHLQQQPQQLQLQHAITTTSRTTISPHHNKHNKSLLLVASQQPCFAADPSAPSPTSRTATSTRKHNKSLSLRNGWPSSSGAFAAAAIAAAFVSGGAGPRWGPQVSTRGISGGPSLGSTCFSSYVLHKPAGVVSQRNDPFGRETVYTLFDKLAAAGEVPGPPPPARLGAVGRLDCPTTGLIVMTNDAKLNVKLTKVHTFVKRYEVTVKGHLRDDSDEMRGMREPYRYQRNGTKSGEEVWTLPVQVKTLREWEEPIPDRWPAHMGQRSLLEFSLVEGRNRQIRRLVSRSDLKLVSLHRVAVGPLELGSLAEGKVRRVSDEELQELRRLCGFADPSGGDIQDSSDE